MDCNGIIRADYKNVIVIRYPRKECTEEELLRLCSKYGPIDRSANLQSTVDGDTGEAEVCVCFIRITDAEKAFHRLRCKGADVRWLSPRPTPTSPMKQQNRERRIVDLLRKIADKTQKEDRRSDEVSTSKQQEDVNSRPSRKRAAEKDPNPEVPEKMPPTSFSAVQSGATTSSMTSCNLQKSFSSSALISKQASTAACQPSSSKIANSVQATARLGGDRLTSNSHRLPEVSRFWSSHVTSAPLAALASNSACLQSPTVSTADAWSVQSARAGRDTELSLPVAAAQQWRCGMPDLSGQTGPVWIPQAPKLLPVSVASSELNGLSQVQLLPNVYSQFLFAGPPALLLPCVPAQHFQPWGAPVFLVANEPPYGLNIPQQVTHAGLAPTLVLAPASRVPATPLFNPQQMFHAPSSRTGPVFVPMGHSFESQLSVHHQNPENARPLDVLDVPAIPVAAAKCRDIEALYASTLESGLSTQMGNSAARKSLPLSKMKAIESKMDAFLESDDGWTYRILDSQKMFETCASTVPSP